MASTLVIEDGTVVAGADSYVTIVEFEAYADKFGFDRATTWDGYSETVKDQKARVAAQYLDLRYGPRLGGVRVDDDQDTEWPRLGVWDERRGRRWTATRSLRWKDAQCEAIWRAVTDELLPDASVGANITEETKRADVVSKSVKYAGGQERRQDVPPHRRAGPALRDFRHPGVPWLSSTT